MREETGDKSLRRVLSCLSHDWIYEFVFGEQSDMLRQALVDSPHFGTTYLVQTEGEETPLPPPAKVNEKGSMLFVCAGMHGSRSVGFEVVHKKHTSSLLGGEKLFISRLIRDDDNGVLLSIAQRDDLGLIEVSCCTIITPGHKENAFFLFRKEEFFNMVKGCQDRFDDHAAKKAMAYRFSSTEWRQCPKCGTHGPTICGCKMKLIPKKSMFDTVREIENFKAHGGSHTGVAQVSVFDKESGESIFSTRVKSRSEFDVLTNTDEKKWLAAWAMNRAITQKPLRLLQMVMPDTVVKERAMLSSQDVLFSKASISLDLGDALGGVFEDVLSSPRISKDCVTNMSTMLDDVMDVPEYGLLSGRRCQAGLSAMDVCKVESEESSSHTLLTVDEENNYESISSLLERAIGNGDMEQISPSSGNLKSLFNESISISNWDESQRDSNQSKREEQSQPQPQQAHEETDPSKEFNTTFLTRTDTVLSSQPKKSISKDSNARRAVRIAPAPYSVRTEHIDANQRKLELRKARNRASAQRSNLKKKLALQKLKEDLKSMSKREGELRTRERVLREENLKLRAAVCR